MDRAGRGSEAAIVEAADRTPPGNERRERARSRGPISPASGDAQSMNNVRVVCRLRPMNEREKKAGTIPAVTASTERKEVAVVRTLAGGTRQVRSTFHVDDVLSSFSTQDEVFQATLEPLVSQVLAGFEATAFAYGQTGTGKTYTMEGELASEDGRGLVPRAAAAVLDRLRSGEFTEHSITVSYLEIYNEELSDLLAPPHHQPKLDLKDIGSGKGVVCIGLSEVPVSSLQEILDYINKAQERRRIAETRLNARSSRSHCIFTMKVRCRRTVAVGEFENVGKLHLVDLAGSECAKKAAIAENESTPPPASKPGHQGIAEEERERRSINQSLLTLGRVIAALRDNSGRVPYRDSKLTRLLQDALGGKCKTVVIATLSPAMNAVEETISTLTYAEQASGIKNKPVASSLLRTYRSPNAEVRLENGGAPSSACGANDWAELEMKVAYLTQEVEEAQAVLARKYQETQSATERADIAERSLKTAEADLQTARVSIEESSFVREKLAAVADRQFEVASSFEKAFTATFAHGQKLDQLLNERNSASAASRLQVRELCNKAEETVSLAIASNSAAAETALALAAESHAVHRNNLDDAKDATASQHRAVDDMATDLCRRVDELSASARSAADVASKQLDQDQDAGDAALGKVEAAANASSAAATKCSSEVEDAAKQGKEELDRQVTASGADIGSGHRAISTMSKALIDKLEAASASAKDSGDASLNRFTQTVQDPTASLHASLSANTDVAKDHSDMVARLKETCLADSRSATMGRMDVLTDIATLASQHAETLASRPPLLKDVLQASGADVQSKEQTTQESLLASNEQLDSTKTLLSQAADTGKTALAEGLAQADRQLSETWDEKLRKMCELTSVCTDAAAKQRASNSARDMQSAASSASDALKSEIDASTAALASARNDIAAEIVQLKEQRALEERIVSSLADQREALQKEVSAMCAQLETTRATLAKTKQELCDLGKKQQQGRANALEKIMALVSSEFAVLGDEFQVASDSACAQLDDVIVLANGMEETIVAAQTHCANKGQEVASLANVWSESIDAQSRNIENGQERTAEAEGRIEEACSKAVCDFANLSSVACAWGTASEDVATMVDSAASGVAELRDLQERLRPAWAQARDSCSAAAEDWAGACDEAVCGLDGAYVHVVAAKEKVGALALENSKQITMAIEHVASWESDGEAQKNAFSDSSTRITRFFEKEDAKDKQRGENMNTAVRDAVDINDRSVKAGTDLEAIIESANGYVADMPAETQTHIDTITMASSEVAAIADKAEKTFTAAASAIDGFCETHQDVIRVVCDRTRQSTEEIAAQCMACSSEAEAYRVAVSQSIVRARAHWLEFADTTRDASIAAKAEANTAWEAASNTAAAAATRVEEATRHSVKAETDVKQAFEKAAAMATNSLTTQMQDMKASLSREPLLAFDEEKASQSEVVPLWPPESSKPIGMEIVKPPTQLNLRSEYQKAKAEEDEETENASPEKAKDPLASAEGTGSDREALRELNS